MRISRSKPKRIIEESLIAEIFGFGKNKPEVYHSVFLDVGYTERNIRSTIPNFAKSLSDSKVEPSDVAKAMRTLLQNPEKHIAGIPSSKAIWKELKSMGAVK